MNHSISAENYGVRLRPVRMEDAPFIVWLRNLDHVKGRVGDSAQSIASQEDWLNCYFKREGDYYFIIETLSQIPVGTCGIYEVADNQAESGRWIIRPGVMAAIPSSMIAFDIAFRHIGLSQLRISTVATNHTVLSLNKKLGFKRTGIAANAQSIDGQPVDIVHFIYTAEDWSHVRPTLLSSARVAERQITGWVPDGLDEPAYISPA